MKLLIKQINLLHLPLFEFDVDTLDGFLAEYFDQKYKRLFSSVFSMGRVLCRQSPLTFKVSKHANFSFDLGKV